MLRVDLAGWALSVEKTHLPFGSASGTASRLVTRISRCKATLWLATGIQYNTVHNQSLRPRSPRLSLMRIVGLFFVQYYVWIPPTRSHILMQVSRSVLILIFIPVLVMGGDDTMPILIARRHGPPRSNLIAPIISLKCPGSQNHPQNSMCHC